MNVEGRTIWALLLILMLQLALNYFIGSRNFIIDEGQFLTYSWLSSNGWKMYVDYVDHHAPGLALLGEFLFRIFGVSLFIARITVNAVQLATTIVLFLLAKKMFDEKTALVSCIIFVFTSIVFGGYAFTIQPFSAFFLITAVFLFYRAYFEKKQNKKDLVLLGIVFGFAVVFRHSYFFALALFAVYGAALDLKNKKGLNDIAVRNLAILSGFVIPVSLVVLWLYYQGSLSEAFYWIFKYNQEVYTQTGYVVLPFKSVWTIIPLFSLLLLMHPFSNKKYQALFIMWFIVGVHELFPHAWPFHLMVLTPLVAIGLAKGAEYVKMRLGDYAVFFKQGVKSYSLGSVNTAKFFILFTGAAFVLFGYYSAIYNSFDECNLAHGICYYQKVGEFIQQHSEKDESIFVAGFFPGVYFLSQRTPASRHLFFFAPGISSRIKNETMEDLKKNNPKYIVYGPGTDDYNYYVKVENGKLVNAPKFEENFHEFYEYMNEKYNIEKVYEVEKADVGDIEILKRRE